MGKRGPIAKTIEEKIALHSRWEDGCLIWTGGLRNGRPRHSALRNGKWVTIYVTRELMKAPPGSIVRHTCDNELCVLREHLIVGTQKENVDDMIAKGRGWWQHA